MGMVKEGGIIGKKDVVGMSLIQDARRRLFRFPSHATAIRRRGGAPAAEGIIGRPDSDTGGIASTSGFSHPDRIGAPVFISMLAFAYLSI